MNFDPTLWLGLDSIQALYLAIPFAIVSALIARYTNRNATFWFLASFPFSILAFGYLVITWMFGKAAKDSSDLVKMAKGEEV